MPVFLISVFNISDLVGKVGSGTFEQYETKEDDSETIKNNIPSLKTKIL